MDIYNEKLTEWPVPYESVFLDTSYGKVHVIESGPTDAPPLLLIHASAVAGWSWLDNVGVSFFRSIHPPCCGARGSGSGRAGS